MSSVRKTKEWGIPNLFIESPLNRIDLIHCYQKPWNKNNESAIFKSKRSPAFLAQNQRKVNININKCKFLNIKKCYEKSPKMASTSKEIKKHKSKKKRKDEDQVQVLKHYDTL